MRIQHFITSSKQRVGFCRDKIARECNLVVNVYVLWVWKQLNMFEPLSLKISEQPLLQAEDYLFEYIGKSGKLEFFV